MGEMALRSNAFITVVKSLELWYCDDLSDAQNLARKRTLLAEPQVRSRLWSSHYMLSLGVHLIAYLGRRSAEM